MANFYLITSYAATILCALSFIILFIKRKEGGRARLFLCIIMIISVLIFLLNFLRFFISNQFDFKISIPMMLLAIVILSCRVTYVLEAIHPNFISIKKMLLIFSPLLIALAVYAVARIRFGITFSHYTSITEISENKIQFNEIIIILLCFLYFLPLLYTLYIYEKHANKKKISVWFKRHYLSLFLFASSFIPTLFDHARFYRLQYILLLIFTFYIVYLELFVRISEKSSDGTLSIPVRNADSSEWSQAEAHNEIFDKLENYMKTNKAWRDHDMNMSYLVRYLNTNRTTFARIIQENGHENYSAYINKYRIEDFIEIVNKGEYENYQDVFLDVGFKSRATALRNFKHFVGSPPSEYFKSEQLIDETGHNPDH